MKVEDVPDEWVDVALEACRENGRPSAPGWMQRALAAVIPAIQAEALERAAVHLENVAEQYKSEPDAALVEDTTAFDDAVLLVFEESAAAIRALKEGT